MDFQHVVKEFRQVGQNTPKEFLFDIFYKLFKRKYLILSVSFFTFAGIVFGTYLVTPIWKATAKVRVQLNPKQQLTMYQGITTPGGEIGGVNPANDVVQILSSRAVAEEVVKKFNREELWRQREENPEKTRDIIRWNISNILIGKPIEFLQSLGILSKTPENYFASAVEELQKDLEDIELEEDTTVVNVSVWGESPKIATGMANTLVELLLIRNLEMSKDPVDKMINTTTQHLRDAEKDLRSAEDNLRRFKEKTRIVSYGEETRVLIERLDRYETEAKNLEGRLASLRVEKQPDHPEIKNIEAQIKEYNKISIPAIKSRLAAFPRQEVELARLNQDLETKQGLYLMLKEKLLDMEVLKGTSLGALDLKVIDPAKVYEFVHPDWPRWVINIPLGFIASLLTALSFVFFIEYWDNSFKSIREIEERVTLHTLGAMPYLSYFRRKRLIESISFEENNVSDVVPIKQSVSKEKLPRFITPSDLIVNAMFVKNEVPLGKVFLITSPGPREGKSTMIAVMAQTLSRRGKKVLLIDTNLRNPSLERIFQMRGEKGLYNLYEEDLSFQEIITKVREMDVIFPGNNHELRIHPFDLLCGERFESFLNQARSFYDFIILDSPSVRTSKDPLAMVPLVDGVVLVIEANRTQEKTILMAKEKIEDTGGVIKGIILNKQINYVPSILQTILD